jgi:hypothetical protein
MVGEVEVDGLDQLRHIRMTASLRASANTRRRKCWEYWETQPAVVRNMALLIDVNLLVVWSQAATSKGDARWELFEIPLSRN